MSGSIPPHAQRVLTIQPAYSPSVLTYTVAGGSMSQLGVSFRILASDAVTIDVNGTNSQTIPLGVTTPSLQTSLDMGLSILHLTLGSTVYSFWITVVTPIIESLQVKALATGAQPKLVTLSPALAQFSQNYTATLPFTSSSVELSFVLSFGDPATVQKLGSSAIVVNAPASTATVMLSHGFTEILFTTPAHGEYYLRLTNPPPTVSALSLGAGISALEPAFDADLFAYHANALTLGSQGMVITLEMLTGSSATFTVNGTSSQTINHPATSATVNLAAGANTVAITTSAGTYIVVVYVEPTIYRSDITALSFASSLDGITHTPVALLPIFDPFMADFAATVYHATSTTPVQVTLATTCSDPCTSWITANGVFLRQLQTGVNTMTVTNLRNGTNAIVLLTTPSVPPMDPALNHTVTFNIAVATACTGVSCLNNATCFNQPSASYGTPFTCYCTYGYSGRLCASRIFTGPVPAPSLPVAVVSVPSQVIDCDGLLLDGSASYNLGPEALGPFYEWKLTSVVYQQRELVDTSSPAFSAALRNQVFGQQNDTLLPSSPVLAQSRATIYILGTQLVTGAQYTFALKVGNSLYTSAVASRPVRKIEPIVPVNWFPVISLRVPGLMQRPLETTLSLVLAEGRCGTMPSNIALKFVWTVSLTSRLNSSTPITPQIADVPAQYQTFTSTSRDLVVSPNFFFIGYIYTITLRLTMSVTSATGTSRRLLQTFSGVTATATASQLRIGASPPVASIVGGDRWRAVDNPNVISGQNSYDPDVFDTYAYAVLTYEWSCVKDDGFDCQLPSSIALSQSKVGIPANTLSVNSVYTFTLIVRSIFDYSRTASTSMRLTTLPPSTVLAPLASILNVPARVNVKDSLRLLATVVTSTTTPIHYLQYRWSVTTSAATKPDLFDQSILGAPVNSSSLVLLPNKLASGVHQFTLRVTDPFTLDASDRPAETLAGVTVIVNEIPQPGQCSITPETGEALTTIFSIECSLWYESVGSDFQPFSYAFQYLDLARPELGYQQLSTLSQYATASFRLPGGRLRVRSTIMDTQLASNHVDIDVTVTQAVFAVNDPLAYIKNVTAATLQQYVNQQDWAQTMILVQQLSLLLNDIDVSTASVAAEVVSIRNGLLSTLDGAWKISVAQSSTKTVSATQLNLVSQAMSSLSLAASNFSDPSTTTASGLMSQILDALDASPSVLSFDSGSVLAGIISNFMTSCARFDSVSTALGHLLRLQQSSAVAGEGFVFETLQFTATVQRNLVSSGTSITLPSGFAVSLSPAAMQEYAAQLNRNLSLLNSTDPDGASLTAAMDTRIVTWNNRWSACRAGGAASMISSMELTLPDGTPIDFSKLSEPVRVTIPLTQAALDAVDALEPCPGDLVRNRSEILNDAFTCSYWSQSRVMYLEDGCVSDGVTTSSDSNNTSYLTCSCTHLAEFVARRTPAATEHDCPLAAFVTGGIQYLIFLILYGLVACLSLVQFMRIWCFYPLGRFWLMTCEHMLIIAFCLARAANQLIYWKLADNLSPSVQSLIAGLPYLFISWIFSFVIVAWASILAQADAAKTGQRKENPFKQYQSRFILANFTVSLIIFFLFISMATTSDPDHIERLRRAGTLITCAVEIGFTLFFIAYGSMLNSKALGAGARRLSFIAIGLSVAFAIAASILIFSIAKSASFDADYVIYESVYNAMDLIGLLLVLLLFTRSVKDAVRSAQKKILESDAENVTGCCACLGCGRLRGHMSSTVGRFAVYVRTKAQRLEKRIAAARRLIAKAVGAAVDSALYSRAQKAKLFLERQLAKQAIEAQDYLPTHEASSDEEDEFEDDADTPDGSGGVKKSNGEKEDWESENDHSDDEHPSQTESARARAKEQELLASPSMASTNLNVPESAEATDALASPSGMNLGKRLSQQRKGKAAMQAQAEQEFGLLQASIAEAKAREAEAGSTPADALLDANAVKGEGSGSEIPPAAIVEDESLFQPFVQKPARPQSAHARAFKDFGDGAEVAEAERLAAEERAKSEQLEEGGETKEEREMREAQEAAVKAADEEVERIAREAARVEAERIAAEVTIAEAEAAAEAAFLAEQAAIAAAELAAREAFEQEQRAAQEAAEAEARELEAKRLEDEAAARSAEEAAALEAATEAAAILAAEQAAAEEFARLEQEKLDNEAKAIADAEAAALAEAAAIEAAALAEAAAIEAAAHAEEEAKKAAIRAEQEAAEQAPREAYEKEQAEIAAAVAEAEAAALAEVERLAEIERLAVAKADAERLERERQAIIAAKQAERAAAELAAAEEAARRKEQAESFVGASNDVMAVKNFMANSGLLKPPIIILPAECQALLDLLPGKQSSNLLDLLSKLVKEGASFDSFADLLAAVAARRSADLLALRTFLSTPPGDELFKELARENVIAGMTDTELEKLLAAGGTLANTQTILANLLKAKAEHVNLSALTSAVQTQVHFHKLAQRAKVMDAVNKKSQLLKGAPPLSAMDADAAVLIYGGKTAELCEVIAKLNSLALTYPNADALLAVISTIAGGGSITVNGTVIGPEFFKASPPKPKPTNSVASVAHALLAKKLGVNLNATKKSGDSDSSSYESSDEFSTRGRRRGVGGDGSKPLDSLAQRQRNMAYVPEWDGEESQRPQREGYRPQEEKRPDGSTAAPGDQWKFQAFPTFKADPNWKPTGMTSIFSASLGLKAPPVPEPEPTPVIDPIVEEPAAPTEPEAPPKEPEVFEWAPWVDPEKERRAKALAEAKLKRQASHAGQPIKVGNVPPRETNAARLLRLAAAAKLKEQQEAEEAQWNFQPKDENGVQYKMKKVVAFGSTKWVRDLSEDITKVNVIVLDGSTVEYQVKPTDTVLSLKYAIQEKETIPRRHQKIMFDDGSGEPPRELQDSQSLTEAGLKESGTVTLVSTLKTSTSDALSPKLTRNTSTLNRATSHKKK